MQRDFLDLREGNLPIARYAGLLLRLVGIHAPIQAILARHEVLAERAWHHDPVTFRPTRLLKDLAVLGVDGAIIQAAPRADRLLPPLLTVAAALECALVVEGSALDGRGLASRLQSTPGIGAHSGAAFFTPLPSRLKRWEACCASIEALGADPGHMADMANAAEATFEVFATWIESGQ